MKLKNVKVGTRVQLKKDYSTQGYILKKGMTGTILEDDSRVPFISWDNFEDGGECPYIVEDVIINLGLSVHSVTAEHIQDLKRIKE